MSFEVTENVVIVLRQVSIISNIINENTQYLSVNYISKHGPYNP